MTLVIPYLFMQSPWVTSKLVESLARWEKLTLSGSIQVPHPFCQIHLNPSFGWHTARAFARARTTFPLVAIGRDRWLFRAYLLHLNPNGHSDLSVREAYNISRQPSTSAKLKAMLITGLGDPIDAHLDIVAAKSGIPRPTVEAFEVLFFNVLDRHQDGAYISHIVYPDGRAVELKEDYFETTPIPDLLLRVAYNKRDIDLVARLSGMDASCCAKELASLQNAGSELEKHIMANALLIGEIWLLNQPSVGMQRAIALLTAKRSARKPIKPLALPEDYDVSAQLRAALEPMGPAMTEADQDEVRTKFPPGRSYRHDEDGNIFVIDDDDELPHRATKTTTPQ